MKYKWDYRKGKLYAAIKLSLLILIFFTPLLHIGAYAYSDSDLQWIDAQSKRLEWTQSFTANHGGNSYKIETIDFIPSEQLNAGKEPFVFINLYENNILVLNAPLSIGNPEIYNEEIKLAVTKIISTGTEWDSDVYNPWAVVEISFIGTPDLNIYISTDKSEYDLPTSQSYLTTHIELSVVLKNTGGADAKNVNLNIDTAGLNIVNGQEQNDIGDLKKGETKSNILKLEIPRLLTDLQESYSYNIRVNAQGEDIKGNKISKLGEHIIKIKPKFSDTDLVISKYLSPSKINIQDNTIVELVVRNGGSYSLNNIAISDEIPSTFNLLDSTRLYWVIPNLKAGEEKRFNYTIKIKDNIEAQKEYLLPAAKMSYSFGGKSYSKNSNNPKISVDLPPVKLTKTLSNNKVIPGSIIGITINVKNIGDRRVKINIEDDLPTNAIFVSGKKNDERYLNVGEAYNIDYEIRLNNNGVVNVPSAIGEINDADGNQWSVQSNIPADVLVAPSTPKVVPPAQQTAPVPLTGYVSVYSDPPNAIIEIDGEYVGYTPRTISVSAGYHILKLTKSGHEDHIKQIYVSDGRAVSVSEKLVEKESLLKKVIPIIFLLLIVFAFFKVYSHISNQPVPQPVRLTPAKPAQVKPTPVKPAQVRLTHTKLAQPAKPAQVKPKPINSNEYILDSGEAIYLSKESPDSGKVSHIYKTSRNGYVAKIYKKPEEWQKKAIEQIVGKYNIVAKDPSLRNFFCWPEAIIREPKLGVLMPEAPSNLVKMIDILLPTHFARLPPERQGNWKMRVKIAIDMAKSMHRMHNDGLCHADISSNNILVDPVIGEMRWIDLDGLVIKNDPYLRPAVAGTTRFMAPELIQEKASPSVETDLHSLAALIYELLLMNHPLLRPGGAQRNDMRELNISSKEQDKLELGEYACYVENPNNTVNRPIGSYIGSEIYGKEFKEKMRVVFVDGIKNPHKRTPASTWWSILSAIYNDLVQCENPKCTRKYFSKTPNKKCPWCGKIK